MRRGFVCSVAALLAGTGLALAQVPAPSGAPALSGSPAMGGGATPYSPLTPGEVPLPAIGLSAGGPGELMTCPGSACGGDCGNLLNGPAYQGTQNFWINGEYLLWRTKTANIPGLNFTQPLGTVTIQQEANVNGTTSNFTQTLPVLMQSSASYPPLSWKDQPGIRFYGGFWFDKDQTIGLDAGFFMLWRRTEQLANVPNPSPTGEPFQLLIPTGFVNTIQSSSGTINAATTTIPINLLANVQSDAVGTFASQFWGTELNVRSRKCYFGCTTIDCIVGVRYLNLQESINSFQDLALTSIVSATAVNGQPSPVSMTTNFNGTIRDSISIENRFYGAQIGFNYDWMIGHGLFLAGWTKLAVGDNHEDIDLHGFTTALAGGGPTNPGSAPPVVAAAGGNLVGPADNNTHRVFDRIAVVPEFAMNLGYQPCAWLRFYGGYTFMYYSSVARPGDQTLFVPTTANVTIGQTTQTGNILAPTFKVQDTGFWAQGLNLGIELRY